MEGKKLNKTDKKNIIKYAFTLAEMLVVLIVIGILAILLLTSLKFVPDKNKTMFKKAYSVLEKSVSELINDEELYPYDPEARGFMNKVQVTVPGNSFSSDKMPDCTISKIYTYKFTKPDCGSGHKFDVLFMDKLNILSVDKCPKDIFGFITNNDGVCFTTSDGIGWAIEKIDFEKKTPPKLIVIDVNGFNKGPNTKASLTKNGKKTRVDGDRFHVHVVYDGKIETDGEAEQTYLAEHSLQEDDDE